MAGPNERCRIVHSLLIVGSCPYCECGARLDDLDALRAEPRVWDVAAIAAILNGSDERTLFTVVLALGWFGPAAHRDAIPLFEIASDRLTGRMRKPLAHAMYALGKSLPTDAVAVLEREVADRPDSYVRRAILLGAYGLAQYDDPLQMARRREHALWLIAHRPDDATTTDPHSSFYPQSDLEGFGRGADLWDEQVRRRGSEYAILRNAARYFAIFDSAKSEQLFQRAKAADSSDPEPYDELGHAYLRRARSGPDDRIEWLRRAIEEFEQALARTISPGARPSLIEALAKATLRIGNDQRAGELARELLDLGANANGRWYAGNAVHYGHIVLGHIALRACDFAGAIDHLDASVATPGSPQLDTFGPDFSLARDLLMQNQTEAVVRYLQECSTFWGERVDLATWIEQIRDGQTPRFPTSHMILE